jgi:hypothetical protein
MKAFKTISGQRIQLEQELVKALLTGEMDEFDRINQRLSVKASLSLCRDLSASDQDGLSAPRQSDEAPT